MTLQLRDYQEASIQALYDYFTDRRGDAPLLVVPTGGGKSLINAAFMQRALTEFPGTRIMLVSHVKELISQDFQELMRVWPQAPAGIYSAGLGRRQARAQLLFAGVQSVYRKAREIGHVDIMVIDEAHLMGRNDQSQYGRLVAGLRDINPSMKIVGLTATPFRTQCGMLHRGDGAVFDGIAYTIDIAMLVQRGYLCPLISKRPDTVFNLTGLHHRMGDFVEKEMADRFAVDEVTDAAVTEIIALGEGRKAWLAFCINVAHALQVRDALRLRGINAETVTGETPAAERDRLLRDFKAGRIRCLTSVNVVATGFNAPHVDLIALMRPTESTGLYLQQVGRGLRTSPGKENCLVLDFAQVILRHGPVDAITLPGDKRKGEGDGAAPAKVCPQCDSIILISARECPDCGHLFPPPEPKIERTASVEAIMNLTAVEEWRPVLDVNYAIHRKPGSPESLRVEYLIGPQDRFVVVSEWVCFGHGGYARQKAVQWWAAWGDGAPPESTAEAMSRLDDIRRAAEAVVVRDGKYHRIKRLRAVREIAA